jgi:hypothetical protein
MHRFLVLSPEQRLLESRGLFSFLEKKVRESYKLILSKEYVLIRLLLTQQMVSNLGSDNVTEVINRIRVKFPRVLLLEVKQVDKVLSKNERNKKIDDFRKDFRSKYSYN